MTKEKHPDSIKLAKIAGVVWMSDAYSHLNCQGKVEVTQELAIDDNIFPGKIMRGWYKGSRHMWLVDREGDIIDPAQHDTADKHYEIDSTQMKKYGNEITKRLRGKPVPLLTKFPWLRLIGSFIKRLVR